jgi:hypothetical protein
MREANRMIVRSGGHHLGAVQEWMPHMPGSNCPQCLSQDRGIVFDQLYATFLQVTLVKPLMGTVVLFHLDLHVGQ